jgi:hypothetical protein
VGASTRCSSRRTSFLARRSCTTPDLRRERHHEPRHAHGEHSSSGTLNEKTTDYGFSLAQPTTIGGLVIADFHGAHAH